TPKIAVAPKSYTTRWDTIQVLAAIRQTGALGLWLADLHAKHAADFRDTLIKKYGLPAPLAAALAASAELESGLDSSVTQSGKNGHGQGLFQLTDRPRKDLFKKFSGTTIEKSTADQQIKYQVYELTNNEKHTFALAQRVGSDAASLAAGYSYYVVRPKQNFRDSADRYAVARALDKIPVK
uniref:phage tail tip lysozyme n=1 Tax=Novosphingobium sp. TaxID=1874826 RepID=UPI003342BDBA